MSTTDEWKCPVCGNNKHEQLVDTEGYGHLQEPGSLVGRAIGFKCTQCTVQFQDADKFNAAGKESPTAKEVILPKGRCSDYRILRDVDLAKLEKKINEYIVERGFCLHGGLIIEPHDSMKKQGGSTQMTGQQYVQVVKKLI